MGLGPFPLWLTWIRLPGRGWLMGLQWHRLGVSLPDRATVHAAHSESVPGPLSSNDRHCVQGLGHELPPRSSSWGKMGDPGAGELVSLTLTQSPTSNGLNALGCLAVTERSRRVEMTSHTGAVWTRPLWSSSCYWARSHKHPACAPTHAPPHEYMHTTLEHTHIQHTCMCVHMYVHVCEHMYVHTCAYTLMSACVDRPCTNTYVHTYTYEHTCTHINTTPRHTYTHEYTHA